MLKKFLLVLLLSMFAAMPFAQTAFCVDFPKAYVEAKKKLEKMEKTGAHPAQWSALADEFRKIYSENPAWSLRPAALYRSGLAYEKRAYVTRSPNDAGHALKAYDEMVRSHPGSALADDALYRSAAVCADILKDNNKASAHLLRIMQKYPKSDHAGPAMKYAGKLNGDKEGTVNKAPQKASAAAKQQKQAEQDKKDKKLPADAHKTAAKTDQKQPQKTEQKQTAVKDQNSPSQKTDSPQQTEITQKKKAEPAPPQNQKADPKSKASGPVKADEASGAQPQKPQTAQAQNTAAVQNGSRQKSKNARQPEKTQQKSAEPAPPQNQKAEPKSKASGPVKADEASVGKTSGAQPQKPQTAQAQNTAAVQNGPRQKSKSALQTEKTQQKSAEPVPPQNQKAEPKDKASGEKISAPKQRTQNAPSPAAAQKNEKSAQPAKDARQDKKQPEAESRTTKAQGSQSGKISDPRHALAAQLGLTVRTVVIDPGHGGKDPGTSHHGVIEKNVNLNVALRLKTILEKQGFSVKMTRSENKWITLGERVRFGKQSKGDLFVSIHVNACDNPKIHGLETYILDFARTSAASRLAILENADSGRLGDMDRILTEILRGARTSESVRLAESIQKETVRHLKMQGIPLHSGGVKGAPFFVLVGSRMPSVLVELGYCTNAEEAKRLNTDRHCQSLAQGIAAGILAYAHNLTWRKK